MLYVILIVFAVILAWYIFKSGSNGPQQPSVGTNADLQMFGCKDNGYSLSVWPKVSGIGHCVDFYIAGITFRDGISRYQGEFVGRLVPEPSNPHDPNAIRIEASDGTKVGYVPKDRTSEVRAYAKLPCACCCFIARRDDRFITCCYIKV